MATVVKSPYPFLITVGIKNKETKEKNDLPIKPKGKIVLPEGFFISNETLSQYKDLKIIKEKEQPVVVIKEQLEVKEETPANDSKKK